MVLYSLCFILSFSLIGGKIVKSIVLRESIKQRIDIFYTRSSVHSWRLSTSLLHYGFSNAPDITIQFLFSPYNKSYQ
jgi:hypothetical protein